MSSDDILWVGFDDVDLDTIERAMQWIVNDAEDGTERRQAQNVIVTIDAARIGDWTPYTSETLYTVDTRAGHPVETAMTERTIAELIDDEILKVYAP